MSGLWICLVLALSFTHAAAMDPATETRLRLGWDIPMERIDDVEGRLTLRMLATHNAHSA